MMLNGTVHRKNGERREDFALNDIVIGKAGSQQVLQFQLYVNRKLLNKYLADGMCRACGCFVELRAAIKTNVCSYGKW